MNIGLDALVANVRAFRPTALPTEGLRHAAVALVVNRTGSTLGIWLTRRASRLRAHPGQFALPGGRLDPGENAVDAALRELGEELGVVAPQNSYVGTLDDYATRSGYVITPVVFALGDAPPLAPNRDEVAEVYTIPLADLDVEPRYLRIPESEHPVIQVPLVGSLIHAPTAAVLHQFREVALHGRATQVAHLEQPVWAWR
ncbi:NUDIX hydrolase [Cryptosporangium aurantiacum]|uniref:ADP-ribose pyrophosphatase YjhB, NUDIX family n=1 Tax=Cryptosporangium aurantiacum TaxID=134849 RepID=A0A1M7R9D4_9ACTN|nr:CoA pyrophosphatase [Cryptosporangium aurantiacum]SHN42760.1 ADP-ribose pyrophosphatase YjhB, NUDIX family [Cryptosporangium aurantiacum]